MAYSKSTYTGRKPKYKTPEEIQKKIDAYFVQCEGTLLRNSKGDPVVDRMGHPVYVDRKPPTITGLALALGFTTRKGLLRYQAKKEFMDVILEAKTRIEMYTEEQLFTRDGAKGAQFALRCNFAGWQEEKKEENQNAAITIINDIPKGSAAINTDTAVFNVLQKPEDDTATENGTE